MFILFEKELLLMMKIVKCSLLTSRFSCWFFFDEIANIRLDVFKFSFTEIRPSQNFSGTFPSKIFYQKKKTRCNTQKKHLWCYDARFCYSGSLVLFLEREWPSYVFTHFISVWFVVLWHWRQGHRYFFKRSAARGGKKVFLKSIQKCCHSSC